MSRVFWIIIIVCVVIFGAVWVANRSRTQALTSGEVSVRDQPGDKAKTDLEPTQTAPSDQPASPEQPAQAHRSAPNAPGARADGESMTPPAADSISRDPPNGMVFAGTGRYQLYRQGDITWRLNTDTGQACILFATDREWSKPRVFEHGCGGK